MGTVSCYGYSKNVSFTLNTKITDSTSSTTISIFIYVYGCGRYGIIKPISCGPWLQYIANVCVYGYDVIIDHLIW